MSKEKINSLKMKLQQFRLNKKFTKDSYNYNLLYNILFKFIIIKT